MGGAGLSAHARPVSIADLDTISEIFAWYVKHTVTTFEETPRALREWEELLVLLNGLGLPFFVAEVEGRIAGYAYASPWRHKPGYRHTVEDSVFIAHGLTGRGIGRLLLGELLSSCSDPDQEPDQVEWVADSAWCVGPWGGPSGGAPSSAGRKMALGLSPGCLK